MLTAGRTGGRLLVPIAIVIGTEQDGNGMGIMAGKTLCNLHEGETAVIESVGGEGALRQHFLDMGLIPGAVVTLVKFAPMGDPMELRIHGYELTLRLADAANIPVREPVAGETQPEREEPNPADAMTVHPGLGQDGKYHVKTDGQKLPKGTPLTFALVGNQNCGKTTLFNQLTGSNQHVGNFPGVTVDRKDGAIKGYPGTSVTDLPGIYSLSPYTAEEIVSRNFILEEKPTGIINILDATNIERNLYLTLQLMELGVPMVIALNMMDEVRGNGGSIDVNRMEEMLGVPVVPISAAKNEGVSELIEHAVHVAEYQERPGRPDFCGKDENGGAVHRCLHGVMYLIEDHAEAAEIPARFAAAKLLEGDKPIFDALKPTQNEAETLEHIITQMEEERGLDRVAAVADMRFSFIRDLCSACVKRAKESREHLRSAKIDKIVTGKYTAIPSFIAVMALVFWLSFNVIGGTLQRLLDSGITALAGVTDSFLARLGVNEVLHSLLIDGIFAGVGSVLSFIPIILTLFFFLSMMEDSGYMARVAFVTDRLLRKIGLSGRSIVPMLIGFGCTVPAVMSTRTLSSARDRKMTIMLSPFMSCTAKIPIYGFIAHAFFPRYSGLIMVALYFLGILLGVCTALLSKRTLFRGEPVPFVLELPNYRMPGAKNVLHLLWDKAKDFLQRAFTVIFLASVIIWFLQTFDYHLALAVTPDNSILASLAGWLAPVFTPLGFGNWQVTTALLTGFLAKESVVGTLEVLTAGNVAALLSPAAAISLLIFCLLYTPCVAAVTAVKRELGWKWATAMVVFQCVLAWLCAGAAALILTLF